MKTNFVKQALVNFYRENKVLSSILIGMVGLPIALFLVAGILALALIILSFFFGEIPAAAILLMMIVGAIGGYVWSHGK